MYTIYALVDPRNGEIKYVGLTKDVYVRFAQHIRGKSDHPQKDAWIQELKQAQIQELKQAQILVHLEMLEQVEDLDLALNRENHWIDFWLAEGCKLFNRTLPIEVRKRRILSKRSVGGRKRSDAQMAAIIETYRDTGALPGDWTQQMVSAFKKKYSSSKGGKYNDVG